MSNSASLPSLMHFMFMPLLWLVRHIAKILDSLVFHNRHPTVSACVFVYVHSVFMSKNEFYCAHWMSNDDDYDCVVCLLKMVFMFCVIF
jgi:hypothetical protein